MSKREFTILIDEVFNEFDCLLKGLDYNNEGICTVTYYDGFYNRQIFVAYRFMNRARLRLKIMKQLNLLYSAGYDFDFGV